MMFTNEINLTNEQVKEIQDITAKTRYEALDKVAKILNAKTAQRGTWASSRKTIVIDEHIHADITFSKGKVTKLEYYTNDERYFKPLDIKNYKATNNDDKAIKNLQKKLGAMLLPR